MRKRPVYLLTSNFTLPPQRNSLSSIFRTPTNLPRKSSSRSSRLDSGTFERTDSSDGASTAATEVSSVLLWLASTGTVSKTSSGTDVSALPSRRNGDSSLARTGVSWTEMTPTVGDGFRRSVGTFFFRFRLRWDPRWSKPVQISH